MNYLISCLENGRFTQIETEEADNVDWMMKSIIDNKLPSYVRDNNGNITKYNVDNVSPRRILEAYVHTGWIPFGFMDENNPAMYDYIFNNSVKLTEWESKFDGSDGVRKIYIFGKAVYVEFFKRTISDNDNYDSVGCFIVERKYMGIAGVCYTPVSQTPILKYLGEY